MIEQISLRLPARELCAKPGGGLGQKLRQRLLESLHKHQWLIQEHVMLEDCSISTGVGAGHLETLWRDPAFDSGQRAFYYVRALENPTCRWSTWDAVRSGVEPRGSLHATIQERAWSSPIWYVPLVGPS